MTNSRGMSLLLSPLLSLSLSLSLSLFVLCSYLHSQQLPFHCQIQFFSQWIGAQQVRREKAEKAELSEKNPNDANSQTAQT